VTIGDSIPFGQDDCGGCPSFTDLYAAAIHAATGHPVTAANMSTHDDLTGARLVDRLKTSPLFRDALTGADIVVVTIGHNDTPWNSTDDPCDGNNPDMVFHWSKYTGECVVRLAARHGPSVEVLDAFAKETCRVAELHRATCVDVYHAFNGPGGTSAAGDLLAADYTHPSAKGQALIADLLAKAGLAPLQ
jgi:lysophospholipase L1-like esterase